MALVSVVITSYNSGPFLERAVRSVLAQTMHDFEVIVIDDGSTVPQTEVADLDQRIRFYAQHNRGVSVARNVGAWLAKTDLIAFLDHDDEWLPQKLEIQLAAVEANPDAAFWMTGFDWVTPHGVTPAPGAPIDYRGILRGTMINICTVMVRKAEYFGVGGHNPLLTHAEDNDLFLRLTMEGRDPFVVPDRLALYNAHGMGATADYRSVANASLALLEEHEARARRRRDQLTLEAVHAGRRRVKELFAYQAIDMARKRSRTQTRQALRDFFFALHLRPRVALRSLRKAIGARVKRLSR